MIETGFVNVLDLAKYITAKCTKDLSPISNLQLQKILYNIQKKYIEKNNSALFIEDIEAWKFGPVIPEAYRQYSIYGAMPIIETDSSLICEFQQNYNLGHKDIELIDYVIEENRKKDVWLLVDETHKPKGAWDRVYNSKSILCNKKIDLELIKEYG